MIFESCYGLCLVCHLIINNLVTHIECRFQVEIRRIDYNLYTKSQLDKKESLILQRKRMGRGKKK